MGHRRHVLAAAAAATAAASLPSGALAIGCPDRPIRLVVPLAAGGSADLLARLAGQHLGRLVGQPLGVDRRPAGDTEVGSHVVAKAQAIAGSGSPGAPDLEAVAWLGVAAPLGRPPDAIARLADGLQLAMNDREIRRQGLQHGLQPSCLGPAAVASHIHQRFERHSLTIDAARIAPS